jgi:opacity protein-like surface antigen
MKAVMMALAAAAAMAVPAAAQRGIAVEVRGGAAAGNFAEAATDFEVVPAPSFGATVSYAATRRVAVYAGYSRSSFGCESGFCAGNEVTFTSQGFDAGVRLSFPVAAGPWARLGVVSHSLDADGGTADGEAASGVGFELGGGVELPLGRRLSVTPGVRYVRYGAANEDGVAMLVGDVGLMIRL